MHILYKIFIVFLLGYTVAACSNDEPENVGTSWRDSSLCKQLSNTSWQLYSIVFYSEEGREVDRSDRLRPEIFTLTTEDYITEDNHYFKGKRYDNLYTLLVNGEKKGFWFVAENNIVTSEILFEGEIYNLSSNELQIIFDYGEIIGGSAYQIEYYKRVDNPGYGSGAGSSSSGNNADIITLINENVKYTAGYYDFTWHFKIESTLHNVIKADNIVFGIGHGVVPEANLAYGNKTRPHIFYGNLPNFPYAEYTYVTGGVTYILFENNEFSYNISQSGDTQIIKYENPFYNYYWYGVDIREYDNYGNYNENLINYSEAAVYGSMSYASFRALNDKDSLTSSESDFLKNLEGYLKGYEKESRREYRPTIYVKIDNKYYKIVEYKLVNP